MPKSKSRKKKTSPNRGIHAHVQQPDHSDWHAQRRQAPTKSVMPNGRSKQNANWEKRG